MLVGEGKFVVWHGRSLKPQSDFCSGRAAAKEISQDIAVKRLRSSKERDSFRGVAKRVPFEGRFTRQSPRNQNDLQLAVQKNRLFAIGALDKLHRGRC